MNVSAQKNLKQDCAELTTAQTNPLNGYDMLLAISQYEINSQFARLYGTYIDNFIDANVVDNPTGDTASLSSYIRGGITAPEVDFNSAKSNKEIGFNFSFQKLEIKPTDLHATPSDFTNAFKYSPDNVNGILVKTEDITYEDTQGQKQTLKNQKVYYWLQVKHQTVGTQKLSTYHWVPAIHYKTTTREFLISLEALTLSFDVSLNSAARTQTELTQQVSDGILPKEILSNVIQNGFDPSKFGLKQLFLNFDKADLAKWLLTDPAGSLPNGDVTYLDITSLTNYKVNTTPLSQMQQKLPNFRQWFDQNLEAAFGFPDGQNPYLIGVNMLSLDPTKSNPADHPSLVPTDISYSTVPNAANPDLAALNYQIMCANKPVPKNPNGVVENVTTNVITQAGYSGELLVSETTFFTPHLLSTLQNSLNAKGKWTRSGNTWSSDHSSQNFLLNVPNKSRPLVGKQHGSNQIIQDDTDTKEIALDKTGQVHLKGSFERSITVKVRWYIIALALYEKWITGSFQWNSSCSMSVVPIKQTIQFNQQPHFSPAYLSKIHANANALGAIILTIIQLLTSLVGQYIDPLQSQLQNYISTIYSGLGKSEQHLSFDIKNTTVNSFLSPTGTLFSLANPRFDDELNLRAEVTYNV